MSNKKLPHAPAFAAGLALVALALTACGGANNQAGQGGTPTTTPPASSTTAVTTTVPTTTTTSQAAGQPAGGPVPARFDPVSFTAISDQEFWLMGEAPCSNQVCTSIVRTTDGGSSFVGLPAPAAPITEGQGPGVSTLRFADPENGYAFALGGQADNFWVTHDGGEHWSQPAGLAGKTLMAFGTGGGYAFALVGKCQSGGCSSVALERSSVSDDSWSALSAQILAGAGPTASMTVHGSYVWLSVGSSSSQQNEVLLAGTASGASFNRYTSPCSPDLGGTIAATSDDVLWAVCPTGMMAQAFRSTDGGAHWSQPLNTGELVNSTQLAPASDTTAYLVPSNGPFLATSDGGQSWHSVPGTTTTGSWSWAWTGFTDAQTGSALQEEGTAPAGWPWPNGPLPYELYRTTDGGTSWSEPVKISA